MPLTPADVHNVAFSKPPIGKRGYNEDEVDQFLDLVEDTLAQLQDENDDLRARVEELSSGQSAPAAPVAKGGDVDEAAVRRQVEAKLRDEYEERLNKATKAQEKAQAELTAAREEAKKAREDAEKAAKNASAPAAAAAPARPAEQKAPAGVATADTHVQAAKVLGLAQEMAERLTSDAQNEAQTMLQEAKTAAQRQLADADASSKKQVQEAQAKAERTTRDAEQQATQLVAEAEKKAKETTADATSRAEAQVRQAEEKAKQLQADAERKHTEIMNTVKQQQSALEARIAELRTFEREYRTRLKTLLTSQLEELESRGSFAPNGDK